MHCDEAPCIDAAPDGAVYKRRDGLVIVDPVKAAGRPRSWTAVPTERSPGTTKPRWPRSAQGARTSWTRAGADPLLQAVPPESKLVLADEPAMAVLMKAEALEIYRPELGTAPRVFYKNLYRWTKVFVAGSAYFADSGDCAEGCEVTISRDDAVVAKAMTNNSVTSWWTGWTRA